MRPSLAVSDQSYGLQKHPNSTWVILTHTTMKGPFGSQIRVLKEVLFGENGNMKSCVTCSSLSKLQRGDNNLRTITPELLLNRTLVSRQVGVSHLRAIRLRSARIVKLLSRWQAAACSASDPSPESGRLNKWLDVLRWAGSTFVGLQL